MIERKYIVQAATFAAGGIRLGEIVRLYTPAALDPERATWRVRPAIGRSASDVCELVLTWPDLVPDAERCQVYENAHDVRTRCVRAIHETGDHFFSNWPGRDIPGTVEPASLSTFELYGNLEAIARRAAKTGPDCDVEVQFAGIVLATICAGLQAQPEILYALGLAAGAIAARADGTKDAFMAGLRERLSSAQRQSKEKGDNT